MIQNITDLLFDLVHTTKILSLYSQILRKLREIFVFTRSISVSEDHTLNVQYIAQSFLSFTSFLLTIAITLKAVTGPREVVRRVVPQEGVWTGLRLVLPTVQLRRRLLGRHTPLVVDGPSSVSMNKAEGHRENHNPVDWDEREQQDYGLIKHQTFSSLGE